MISGLLIKMALSRQNRRMFLQRLAIKQKMLLRREGDEMHAEYRKFSIPMYPFQLVGDRHGVDLVGSVAHQAEHDTAIRGAALSGRAKRAVELDPQLCEMIEEPSRWRRWANIRAALIGPTVWKLDGPMLMVNKSNAPMDISISG